MSSFVSFLNKVINCYFSILSNLFMLLDCVGEVLDLGFGLGWLAFRKYDCLMRVWDGLGENVRNFYGDVINFFAIFILIIMFLLLYES